MMVDVSIFLKNDYDNMKKKYFFKKKNNVSQFSVC
jgi:hypothetical protein